MSPLLHTSTPTTPESTTPETAVLTLRHLPCLNYAMAVNGRRCIETCELTNGTDEDWCQVHITLNGELIQPAEAWIDRVPAGATVSIDKIDVTADVDKLRDLSESTPTQFTARVMMGDDELCAQTCEIRLLAFDEWPGISVMPETTAAFVTPNAPELADVRMETAKFLSRFTGSPSLDAYQTQDPNRVRAQVAAVYEALRSVGMVYITPPASFEESGQRLRLTDKVLAEKMGTCADLSVLYASVLESMGLRPLLIMCHGHMFVGCWLVAKFYPQVYCDDASFLSKSMADGINELVLVEATMLTQPNVPFEMAVQAAERHIYGEASDFIMALDIHRCRMEGIRPLPVKIDGVWQQEGLELGHATHGVKEQTQYDLPAQEAARNATRLEIWERKLLDFSLRNNLLNLRLGRRTIPFISIDIDLLEDHLQAKEDYLILPCPGTDKIRPDDSGMYQSKVHSMGLEQIVTEAMKSHHLCSYLQQDELNDILKKLYRDSRTAMEENGANTLYMVLGLLKWYETERSVKPRYAPLLLLPVTIVKKSGNNYVLRVRDEEITFNTTLVEMMRQQYDLHLTGLTPLPTDDSGIDVLKVFAIVRSCLKDHPRWDIVEESLLSLFSFSKFVMWNDIHNNADKLRQNDIIESLIQKRLVNSEGKADTDTRSLDKTMEPARFAIPVDVDSSQLEAVIESGEGRSFILYGPPGTGKSQTITNMIANALYHNRRVLFVAEKMAALEVVQKRLARIGLDPFCLEMHSNKMTKAHLLQQLQKALDVTRLKSSSEYAEESERLFQQRKQLIAQIERLHRRQHCGLSLYDMITRYLAVEGDDHLVMDPLFLQEATAERIAEAEAALRQLATVFDITGDPAVHPLKGLEVTDPTVSAQTQIVDCLNQLRPLLAETQRQLTLLANSNGLLIAATPDGAQWAQQLADTAAAMPVLSEALLRTVADDRQKAAIQEKIQLGVARDAARSQLLQQGSPELLNQSLTQLRAEWAEACGKWLLPRFFAKRSFVKRLQPLCPSLSATNVEQLFELMERYQAAQQLVDSVHTEMEQLFGPLAAAGTERWDDMKRCLDSAPQVLQLLQQNGTPLASLSLLSKDHVLGADLSAVRRFNQLCTAMAPYATIASDVTLEEMAQRLEQWTANIHLTRDWAQWTTRKASLREAHLEPLVSYIEQGHDSAQAADAMLRSTYKTLALGVIDADPALSMFNGQLFENTIDQYRQTARHFQELTKKALYCQLASRIPSLTIEAANSSEMGILKRHIASGGRNTSIRNILDQIPTLLPKLCPCMLMSPISVAQFIDLDQEKFDLVVFDEASQMPTSEAVGAIARGKAVIVVGDPKQMPPTSFFTTNQVDEGDAENDDMESILDDCITLSLPDHYLTWHYRSRHESLIAFSNAQYYDGKLYTFPSVDDRVSKVQFVSIDGTYDMGRTRSNRAEAQAIVAETLRRLKDPRLKDRSIGIVAFSKAQQDLIEDILVEELSKQPLLERAAYDCPEPIFVKNLENVQGDERDIILFSVGYGPDRNGRVSMNFGPLNNRGGERRLNVAVSRARYEMMVFSTMQPEQIDLNRSRARGVEGLKRFLEFAKNGRMSVASDQFTQQHDTALMDDVARELTAQGYKVDKQVGRSRFKVDLAVLDPDNEGQYLLGLLCDGTGYYSTTTERDREICQPGVLAGLGWQLMRIWSVDWMLNKQRVVTKIMERLEQIKKEKEPAQSEAAAADEEMSAEALPAELSAADQQARKTSGSSAGKSGNGSSAGKSGKKEEEMMAGLADIPFEVSKDEILTAPDNKLASVYKPYLLPYPIKATESRSVRDLAGTPRRTAQDVQCVVMKEQPVLLSVICDRMKKGYNMAGRCNGLRELVERSAVGCYRDPFSDPANPTYWKSEADAAQYKGYRTGTAREMADIPVVEIMNVVVMAVEQQVSISEEDLKRQVPRLLGFTRRTIKSDQLVSAAIGHLCRTGRLQQSEGFLKSNG